MTPIDSPKPHASLPPETSPADNPLGGIGFMLMAAALFSVMDTLAKALSTSFPVGQILLFRAGGALLILLPLAWTWGGSGLLAQAHRAWGKLLVAGLLGAGALSSFIMAWRALPLVEVGAVLFAAPLIVTALSVPILREQVGVHRWSAVVVGFIGVLIVLRPGGAVFVPAALWAVSGTLFYATWVMSLRVAGKAVSSHLVVVTNALIMLALAVPTVLWSWTTPGLAQAAGLVGIGLIGGLAQLCLVRAFTLAPAALVAPFDYSYILYATVLGYVVFGDVPAPATWIGAALLTASGLYIIHREQVRARRDRRDRRASHPGFGGP